MKKIKILFTLLLSITMALSCTAQSRVLTKEKGSHADDIVELTPEFTKAIQKYTELGVFSEGLAAVKIEEEVDFLTYGVETKEKWGYINTKGEEVIPPTIDAICAGRFSEGLAFLHYYDFFCLIDTCGNVVFKSPEGEGAAYEGDKFDVNSAELPYYINGKLYVPVITYTKYAVYDNCGNKTGYISQEEYVNILNEASKNYPYKRFCIEGIYKYGVKNRADDIIVPAKYNYMECDGLRLNSFDTLYINIQNGVFLAGYNDYDINNSYHYYYGYVDLNGNDTFPEGIEEKSME